MYFRQGNSEINARHALGRRMKNVGTAVLIVGGFFGAAIIMLFMNTAFSIVGGVIGFFQILTSVCISMLFEGFGELVNQATDTNKNLEDIKMYLYNQDDE